MLRQFPLTGPSFPQAVFADDLAFITDGAQGAATIYAHGTGGATSGADISVSQQTSDGPTVADQPVTYTVTVTNGSATDATGVSLQDTLPPGVPQAASCQARDHAAAPVPSPARRGRSQRAPQP